MFIIKKYFKLIIITILIIFCALGSFYFYLYLPSINSEVEIVTNEIIKEDITPIVVNEPIYYQVDIKGAINKPGVYKVEENLRAIDVINQAGGLTKLADTSFVNLSKKITDEMVIVIYTKTEIANIKKTLEEKAAIAEELKNNKGNNDAIIIEPIKEEIPSTNDKININLAASDKLMTLPGIGETKASAIIEYRTKNNGFKSIEEIKEVSGIGDSTFDQIKNLITV